MRTVILCLCLLGLTMGVSGQDKADFARRVAEATVLIDDGPPAAILKARKLEVGVVPSVQGKDTTTTMRMQSRVVAKGDVEIRIGQSIISADEAEIRYGGPGEQDDVELRGNVRLKAHLKVE